MLMIFLTVALFLMLSILERRYAYLVDVPAKVRASYATNIKLFVFNDTILSFLSISSLFIIAGQFSGFGLLAGFPDNSFRYVVAFLLLDAMLYLWHRLEHMFLFLWGFHQIHHSDACLNVSTALRFHIGALILGVLVKSIAVIFIAIPAHDIVMYEAIITLFVMAQHSNLRFPAESKLARVFIVPSLHRVHHSTSLKQRDKNFGVVFSFWDQLFGTYQMEQPKGIGLAHLQSMRIVDLIELGFKDALKLSK